MNDGVASGSGDGRHAGEGHGEGAAGGNMAPPQVLLGSGTFKGYTGVHLLLLLLLVSRDPALRDCQD